MRSCYVTHGLIVSATFKKAAVSRCNVLNSEHIVPDNLLSCYYPPLLEKNVVIIQQTTLFLKKLVETIYLIRVNSRIRRRLILLEVSVGTYFFLFQIFFLTSTGHVYTLSIMLAQIWQNCSDAVSICQGLTLHKLPEWT